MGKHGRSKDIRLVRGQRREFGKDGGRLSTKSLPLIGSLALNFLLALWLMNNYFYDQPFRNYVDLTLGQIGLYLILTLGIGGGSSLGYVVLKRNHPSEQGILSELPKADLSQTNTGDHSRTQTVFRLLSYMKISCPYA